MLLGNFHELQVVTGLPRWKLQDALERQAIPNMKIGYERFAPVKAVEEWVQETREKSGARELRGKGPAPHPLTSGELFGVFHDA